jgi:hypothetical protein
MEFVAQLLGFVSELLLQGVDHRGLLPEKTKGRRPAVSGRALNLCVVTLF